MDCFACARNDDALTCAHRDAAASCLPSPREAAGRDQGWGVAPRMPLPANWPIDPPPPTPPRHALSRAEGGEKKDECDFQTAKLSTVIPGWCASTRPGISRFRVRCFASPGMTPEHESAFPRRDSPEVLQEPCPSKQRAQGKPGVRCTRSRAWCGGSTRVSHHEFTGNIRLSPRNGFNSLFRALPGDRALLPPSSADHSANLTPASGCQDHTTSPSAKVSFARTLSCADTVASTASRAQRS
jgi:hypothetical protein